MPRPVHFELPVDDHGRAAAFCGSVFGWDIRQWEGAPCRLVTSGPDSEPGINGALARRSDELAVPVTEGNRVGLFQTDESATP
jgi:predicted enzyme related to lactoylglutathione lyase